jgi:hypothetical protein
MVCLILSIFVALLVLGCLGVSVLQVCGFLCLDSQLSTTIANTSTFIALSMMLLINSITPPPELDDSEEKWGGQA